ncbi:MAG: hypothetical protein ACRDKZ_08185 [Actinomycetota bacterium]
MFFRIVKSVAKGLVAGVVGTGALTLATMVEAKARGKEESNAPAEAAEKMLGFEPSNPQQEKALNNIVHWGYGTALGAGRGALGAMGLEGPGATVLFFGAVWGSALAMQPVLGIAPPPQKWATKELAVDAVRHGIYAGTVSATYEMLDRS